MRGGVGAETAPLTASFQRVLAEYFGKAFALDVHSGETLEAGYSRTLRAESFAVTNGRVKSVKQAEAGLVEEGRRGDAEPHGVRNR